MKESYMHLRNLWFLILLMFSTAAVATEKPIKVWPDEAPGEKGDLGAETATPSKPGQKQVLRISNVTVTTLQFYPAKKNNPGTTVVVCPGGGYIILAWDLEGTEVCDWLNSLGVNAVLLKYRVPRRPGLSKHHVALEDAQEAMRFVRSNAAAFRIDPKQIGVMGFSAGGHLSAMCLHKAKASQQGVSVLPNFALLIYPAYLTTERDTIEAAAELTPVSSDTALSLIHI